MQEISKPPKVCKACGVEKPRVEFHKGYAKCRKCQALDRYTLWHSKDTEDVYALCDPDSGLVCYVGRSANAELRFRDHIKDAKTYPHLSPRKAAWILGLLSEGKTPKLTILESVAPSGIAKRELYWMRYYVSINPNLLNEQIKRGENDAD